MSHSVSALTSFIVREPNLIDAIKSGDIDSLERLIFEGANVNYQDEQGWTPLSWAAGKGDAKVVKLLLDKGAETSRACNAGRTALMIARAAGRTEVVELLSEAEKERGTWKDPSVSRAYCRHYLLRDLREWKNWTEAQGVSKKPSSWEGRKEQHPQPLPDNEVVYLHQDFTVTRSIWPKESIVFDKVTPEWREFCRTSLNLTIPENLL